MDIDTGSEIDKIWDAITQINSRLDKLENKIVKE